MSSEPIKVCSRMTGAKVYLWLLVFAMGMASGRSGGERESELLDRLEKSLLASFGLDERPKVDKSKVSIPPYMLRLYHQQVNQNLEDNEAEEEKEAQKKSKASAKYSTHNLANTVRSFTHSDSFEDQLHPSHEMILHFNVTSVPQRELLRRAELRVMHLRHPSLPEGVSSPLDTKLKRRRWSKEEFVYLHRINVYDVLRQSQSESSGPVHRLLDTRVIDARVNDTTSFDVAPALKRWLRKSHTNNGLFIEVVPLRRNSSLYKEPIHVRLRRSTLEDHPLSREWEQHQPLLVLHTDDEKISPREKRAVSPSAYKRPHCRRYDLYVDFRKVDWHTWIVAPHGYEAFFCEGECPYPLAKHMNATNHAVIQNIIHSRYPNRVPSACCVPIKHSAMSMLYLDKDGKVVLKTYQDMIVESCGCQ